MRARGEGGRASKPLADRFQEAIDSAAMAVGMFGSDEYTNAFHWGENQEREGSAPDVAAAVAAELEALHPTVDWRATVEKIRTEQTL